MKRKVLKGKLLVWLLAMMLLVASMTGCGGKDDDEDKDSKSRKEQSADDEDGDDEDDAKDEDKDSEKDEDSEVTDAKEDEESEEKEEDASKEEDKVVEEEDNKGKTEAESASEAYTVVQKMVDACQGKIMTKSTMDMELQMSIVLEGFAIDMDMVMTGDTYASENPYMTYSDLVLNMNAMGQDIVETTKSYTVEENGKLITYTYTESMGQWEKEDMDIDVATMKEQQNVSYEFLSNKDVEEFELDSKLHNVNGRDAYKLSFTLTGDELQNTLNGMSGMEDLMAEAGMEDLDMSALAVPAVYYVDAETYLIVGMEMSIEGMDEMISDMMEDLMAAEGEEYSMSFSLDKCNMIYSNISYDPVEIPALPAEVLAMQGGGSVDAETEEVNAENTFTIMKDVTAVSVEKPYGWEVSDIQEDYVTFQSPDAYQAVCYNLYKVNGREAFVEYVEETEAAGVIDSGRYVSHGVGPTIGEFETMYLDCTDFDFYYAWAPVGDVWMLVTIADMNGVDMETILNDMLALIVEVE